MKNSTRGTKSAETDGSGLRRAIAARTARIGIIGLGYVGLPLACAVRGAGVSGHSASTSITPKVDGAQRRRQLHQAHPQPAHRRGARQRQASTRPPISPRSPQMDAIIICVPTPLTKHREPDLQLHRRRPAEAIAPHLRPGQLVVLESTTYPGTTREVLQPILEATGLRVRQRFLPRLFARARGSRQRRFRHRRHPEGRRRRRPGRAASWPSRSTTQVVVKTVPVSSPETAEAAKLTENIFRAVNIALVNELKVVFDAMGIDVWEVIEAAKTKPFGFMPFYPGPRPRRALHPDRSVLPDLEGARVRHHHPLHRAGRRDQHRDAAATSSTRLAEALERSAPARR